MIKLILVRHAATCANEKGELSGISECDLSETGKNQVEKLTDYLKYQTVDKIYTSSSTRTKKTIDLFAGYKGIDISIKKNLNELDFGDFDGWKFKEIEEKFPVEYLKLIKEGNNYKFPNGESLIESYNRVSQELDSIIKDTLKLDTNISELDNISSELERVNSKKSKTIVICSHAGTIRNIVAYLISKDYKNHWNYKIDNASVSVVEIENGFSVLTMLNNTEFLK